MYCSNLASATVILGISHGAYGIGGTIAPILATTLATRGVLFSRFYAILLGFRAVNVVATYFAFRHYTNHMFSAQQLLNQTNAANVNDESQNRSSSINRYTADLRALLSALGDRITLTGALFIFAYQGAEVAISGWIISFLIGFRGGDPSKVGCKST